MFADRLRKNMRHLAKWARREGVTCYRLYDADLPEYNLAVDLYERWVHVQEYEAPATVDEGKARERLNAALAVIPDVLGVSPEDVFLKVRRRQRGAAQYGRQGSTGRFHEVGEGGCRFLVNFTDYLDTGLFLDQRSTRDHIAELARGRRFLNLFGYTGAATVRAARAGAAATTTVDLSPTYLAWARRNLELNRITVSGVSGTGTETGSGQHRLIQADAVRWLGVGSGCLRCGVPRSAHVLQLPAWRRALVRRAAGPRTADQGRRRQARPGGRADLLHQRPAVPTWTTRNFRDCASRTSLGAPFPPISSATRGCTRAGPYRRRKTGTIVDAPPRRALSC